MEFNLENIITLAQTIFQTNTTFPERGKKEINTFLTHQKEIDIINIAYNVSKGVWTVDNEHEKGGKFIRFTKIAANSDKPSMIFKIENRPLNISSHTYVLPEKEIVNLLIDPTASSTSKNLQNLQSIRNPYIDVSSFSELIDIIKVKEQTNSFYAKHKALIDQIVANSQLYLKLTSTRDFQFEDYKKLIEFTDGLFKQDSIKEKHNEFVVFYFDLFLIQVDKLITAKFNSIRRDSLFAILSNIKLLRDTKKLVVMFKSELSHVYERIIQKDKSLMLENICEFIDKNLMAENIIEYLRDLCQGSEKFQQNLAMLYADTSIYDILHFENQVNLFFDLKINYEVVNKALTTKFLLKKEACFEKSKLQTLCYFLSAVIHFNQFRDLITTDIEKQLEFDKSKAEEIINSNQKKNVKIVEVLKQCIECINNLQLYGSFQQMLSNTDITIDKIIDSLLNFSVSLIKSWSVQTNKLASSIKTFLDTKKLPDALNMDSSSEFKSLQSFLELQKEHSHLKELVVNSLFDKYQLSQHLVVEQHIADLFIMSRKFFISLMRWKNLVIFYKSLEQKYEKRHLSTAIKDILALESCLKSMHMQNLDSAIVQGESLLRSIEEKITKVTQFENKTLKLLMKSVENVSENFEYIGDIQKLISEFQSSFDANSSTVTILYIQQQMLKVVTLHVKLMINNKKIFLAQGEPLKIQLKKSFNQNTIGTFPSKITIKKMFYNRIQDILRMIGEAGKGLSHEYIQKFIDSHLKNDLESTYMNIEKLVLELDNFIQSEIHIDIGKSNTVNYRTKFNDDKEFSFIELNEAYLGLINKMNYLHMRIKELEKIPEYLIFKNIIKIQTKMAKASILDEAYSTFKSFTGYLKTITTEGLTRSENFLTKFNESAVKKVDNIEAFKALNEFIKTVKIEKDNIQKFYQLTKEANNLLIKLEGESGLTKRITQFVRNWEKMQSLQISSQGTLENLHAELKGLLDSEIIEIKKELASYSTKKADFKLAIQLLMNPELSYVESQEKIVYINGFIQIWSKIYSRASDLKRNCESLEHKSTVLNSIWPEIEENNQFFEGQEFRSVSKMLNFLSKILSFAKHHWITFSRENWKKLNGYMDETIETISQENSRDAFNQSFVKTVTKYQTYFKNIVSLITGEQYSNIDWLELLCIIGIPKISLEEFMFEHLLICEAKIKSSFTQIRDINMRITEETNIRKMIDEVEAWKMNFELKFVNCPLTDGTTVTIIGEWDVIFDNISDFGFQIKMMYDSKFKNKFKDHLEASNEFMSNLDLLYRELQTIQRRFLYLDPILYKAKLEEKAVNEQFIKMKTKLIEFYKRLKDAKQVGAILTIPNSSNLLTEASKLFETIQKILQMFLENKRKAYTRLYLLNDEDLIELMGNVQSPQILQMHLPKIFSSIGGITLNKDYNVHEVYSQPIGKAVETIALDYRIHEKSFELENWLMSIQSLFSHHLRSQLNGYCYDNIEKLEFYKNIEINISRPLQVLFIAQEIIFEAIFSNAMQSKNFKVLNDAYHTFILNLNQHSNKSNQPLEQEKCKQLIMHAVRKVNILRETIEKPEEHKWIAFKTMVYQSFLLNLDVELSNANQTNKDSILAKSRSKNFTKSQVFQNENTNVQSGKILPNSNPQNKLGKSLPDVVVQMAGSQMQYSWEYQGLRTPLVYTTVTDKIFVSLSRCLMDKQGANLTGPAGTGKTESVKYFAQHLARNIVVFNCDEELKFDIMGRIFKGFISDEAFGCFDEFNRLNPNQMSVISQLIQSLQFALRKANEFKSNVFMDDFENYPAVNRNCAVFITMNPKNNDYGARYALPQNLKNLFRVVNVSTPSELQVFKVLLLAEGCSIYDQLASQLGKFFEAVRNEFDKQNHYDWSLRKVKSVIASFRSFRNAKEFLDDNSEADSYCLLKSIETNVMTYLSPIDLQKFEDIMKRIFGDTYDSFKLEKHKSDAKSKNSKSHESLPIQLAFEGSLALWVNQKLEYLDNLLEARDGIILYGSPMSGKSILWKTYLAQQYLKKQNISYYILNPKISNKRLLLGKMNHDTNEFFDGYLTGILRKYQKISENDDSGKEKFVYLIFDSEIDSQWIEALNSVLDDNKMLSLSNGERIAIPPNVKFIFETRTLKHASPATLSRLGIISMETEWQVNFMLCYNSQNSVDVDQIINFRFDNSFITSEKMARAQTMAKTTTFSTRSKIQLDELNSSKSSHPHKTNLSANQINRKTLEFISFVSALLRFNKNQNGANDKEITKADSKNLIQSNNSVDMKSTRQLNQKHANHFNKAPLTETLSIDSNHYKEINFNRISLVFEEFVAKFILDKYVTHYSKIFTSNMYHILDVAENSSRILNNDIFELGIYSLLKNPLYDCVIEQIYDTKNPESESAKNEKNLDDQLSQTCKSLLGTGSPLILYGKRRNDLNSGLETYLGLNVYSLQSVLVIPSSNLLKSKDLLRLLKNNFRIICKNGKKYFDKLGEKFDRNIIVFTNIEAISKDAYDSTEVHELLYMLVNYRFIIDSDNMEKVELPDHIAFVFTCQSGYSTLFELMPLKLLRKCFVVCTENLSSSKSKTFDEIEDIDFLKNNEANLKSNEINVWTSELISEYKKQIINQSELSTNNLLIDLFDGLLESTLKFLSLITFVDKNSVHQAVKWILRANLIIQSSSHEHANLLDQILNQLIQIPIGSFTIMKQKQNDHNIGKSLKFSSHNEFKAYFDMLKQAYNEQFEIKSLKTMPGQIDLFQILTSISHCRLQNNIFNANILAGGRGKGRKTFLHLFAIAEGFELQLFQVQPNGKALKEFRKLMISAFNEIFMSNKKIMIILEEYQLSNLRIIDELIIFAKCGLIKGFETEDQNNLVKLNSEATANLKNSASSPTTKFMDKIISNLCVFVVLDNVKVTTLSLLKTYPSAASTFHVINCDYLLHNSKSIDLIMETQLEKILTKDKTNDLQAKMEQSGLLSQIEQSLETSSFPRYKNFCENIIHVYEKKSEEMDAKYHFFEQGIVKLNEAEQQVLNLQKMAQDKSALIRTKTNETEIALKQISDMYNKTKVKFEKLKESEDKLMKQQFEISFKKEEVSNQLSQLIPVLESALSQVKNISKSHLDELRSLKKPSTHIANVFTALLKLKSKSSSSFEEAKKMLGNVSEFEELSKIDNIKLMDEKTLMDVKFFINKESSSFETKTIFYVSQAAGPIAEFIKAIVQCREFYSSIQPLENTLKQLEKSLENTKKESEPLKNEVTEIEKEISNLKSSYAVKIGETEIYKKELISINKRMETANQLLKCLPDEKTRWTKKINEMQMVKEKLLGLSIASSWTLNFILAKNQTNNHSTTSKSSQAQPLNKSVVQARNKTSNTGANFSLEKSVVVNKESNVLKSICTLFELRNFDYSEFLTDEKFLLDITTSGIPQNTTIINNITSTFWCKAFPLVIDPSEKIINYFKCNGGKSVISISLHDKSLFPKMVACMKSGNLLIIENFSDSFPPYLYPIIRRDFIQRNANNKEIFVCGKQISISNYFRIMFTSKFSEHIDQTSSFTRDYLTLIDNSYGQETLTNYYIGKILEKFDPGLLKERHVCILKQHEFKEKLFKNEQTLLESIGKLGADIIEDDGLIKQLENIKLDSIKIAEQINEAQSVGLQIKTKESKYMSLAEFFAKTFISISKVHLIDKFYNFSIDFYDLCVSICLSEFPSFDFSSNVSHHSLDINPVISCFIRIIARNYGMSMSIDDLSIFLLLLLKSTDKILPSDLNWKVMIEDLHNSVQYFQLSKNPISISKTIKNKARSSSKRISLKLFKEKDLQIYDPDQEEVETQTPIKNLDNEYRLIEQMVNKKTDAVDLLEEKMPDLMNDLKRNFDQWIKWLESTNCETQFPFNSTGSTLTLSQKLLLTSMLRKDRLSSLIVKIFEDYYNLSEKDLTFSSIYCSHLWASTNSSIIFRIREGLDPSSDITLLLKNVQPGLSIEEISCGDENSSIIVNRITNSKDKIFILKNFHLCPKIYDELATFVTSKDKSKNVRIIFITEDANSLPLELINESLKISFDKTQDFKQSILKQYALLGETRFNEIPKTVSQELFCLVYLHVSLCEFEKQPSHFNKSYELGWADLERCINFLSSYKEDTSEQFNLVFAKMLLFSFYGAKIDDPEDYAILEELVTKLYVLNKNQLNSFLEIPTRAAFEEHKEKAKKAQPSRPNNNRANGSGRETFSSSLQQILSAKILKLFST